jgi:hypothetical protein
MTLAEIIAALSAVRPQEIMNTVAARLNGAQIRHAVVGDIPEIGAWLEVAIDRSSRTDAVAVVESMGFVTLADRGSQSHHSRGIVELRLYYVEREMLERERNLAWCSYLTKDEPPSREITPADAEPFVL